MIKVRNVQRLAYRRAALLGLKKQSETLRLRRFLRSHLVTCLNRHRGRNAKVGLGSVALRHENQ
jgi:hypothetical protein